MNSLDTLNSFISLITETSDAIEVFNNADRSPILCFRDINTDKKHMVKVCQIHFDMIVAFIDGSENISLLKINSSKMYGVTFMDMKYGKSYTIAW